MPKLKLVHSSQTATRERNIVGIVHRWSQHGEDRIEQHLKLSQYAEDFYE